VLVGTVGVAMERCTDVVLRWVLSWLVGGGFADRIHK
jgi:hypothetical protein